jgi:hypothetical protein
MKNNDKSDNWANGALDFQGKKPQKRIVDIHYGNYIVFRVMPAVWELLQSDSVAPAFWNTVKEYSLDAEILPSPTIRRKHDCISGTSITFHAAMNRSPAG